ncbi:uncharacterized protein [Rutidosis leptorrhynchoides]|uniref:uncharacterized protein n=1 Tax=Rutidosis leptorrhynchoides TaxID=125765 RepID=UPI003A98F666
MEEQVSEVQGQKYDPYSNTYNPVWRNHPNFNRNNNTLNAPNQYQNQYPSNNQYQNRNYQTENTTQSNPPLNQPPSSDTKIDAFITKMRKVVELQNKSIGALAKEIGNVAEDKETRAPGTIPSYTVLNPNHKEKRKGHGVNMVGTWLSGKAYNNQVEVTEKLETKRGLGKSPIVLDEDDAIVENEKSDVIDGNGVGLNVEKSVVEKFGELDMKTNTIPFPKALKSPNQFRYGKKGPKSDNMWETFKQVKLTEKVSAVISGSLPPKFKDPGKPLILVTMGNFNVKKALLDLGDSIILPSSLVDRYKLGTLTQTDILIQLVDRSAKTRRGMLENVIVKVEDFYYPVDFIVIDIENTFRETQPTITLGRPFLSTIDALVNCRTGVMDISFGNKRSRINIFNSLHTPNVQDYFVLDTNHEQVQKHASNLKEEEEVRKSNKEDITDNFMESQIRTNAEISMRQKVSI